jgi:hypothetical protein
VHLDEQRGPEEAHDVHDDDRRDYGPNGLFHDFIPVLESDASEIPIFV